MNLVECSGQRVDVSETVLYVMRAEASDVPGYLPQLRTEVGFAFPIGAQIKTPQIFTDRPAEEKAPEEAIRAVKQQTAARVRRWGLQVQQLRGVRHCDGPFGERQKGGVMFGPNFC